jgi:alpha-1,3-mannosyltransferase
MRRRKEEREEEETRRRQRRRRQQQQQQLKKEKKKTTKDDDVIILDAKKTNVGANEEEASSPVLLHLLLLNSSSISIIKEFLLAMFIAPRAEEDEDEGGDKEEEDVAFFRRRRRRRYQRYWSSKIIPLLCVGELALSLLIIKYVDYTEIDWIAYGEEVDGFFKQKEYDYVKLGGQTGPLVYPAGFVYCYGFIRWACGEEVRNAQVLFAFLYVFNQWLALRILQRSRKVPIAFYAVTCLSKRMHSIFALRMFNDGVCAIFCHLAVLAFMDLGLAAKKKEKERITTSACLRGFAWLSVATSIKMNALLYLPPALVLLVGYGQSLWEILFCLIVFVGIQIALALPFLLTFPKSYLARAFELTRVFTYKWTVNFKFLSEDRFVSKELARGLLLVHVTALFVAAHRKWFRQNLRGGAKEQRFFWDFFGNFFRMAKRDMTSALRGKNVSTTRRRINTINRSRNSKKGRVDDDDDDDDDNLEITSRYPSENAAALMLAQGNFIGVMCARSLHYQFYSWYFNLLPLILFNRTALSRRRKDDDMLFECVRNGCVMLCVEYCWNKYPSTAFSSLLLQTTHAMIYATCVL